MRTLSLAVLLFAAVAFAQPVPELYRTSYALEAKGDHAGALEAMDRVSAAGVTDYVATLRRGWLLYLVGRYTESVAAYGRAMTLEPKAVEPKLGAMLPAMALRRWKDAEKLGADVLAVSPGDYLALSRTAFIHYQQSRWDQAERFYRQALAFYPASVEMQLGLAWTQLKQGKKDAARAGFERVLQVAPDSTSAQEGLAELD